MRSTRLSLTFIMLVCCTLYGSTYAANQPPVLTTTRTMIISGTGSPAQTLTSQLKGYDPDNDGFTYQLTKSPQNFINSTTLTTDGKLSFSGICSLCTGRTSFEIVLTDSTGLSKTYVLTVKLEDRASGSLKLVSDESASKSTKMKRWHVYLIVLAAILIVGVTASLVMFNCCTFHTDMYSAPMRRPNRIEDTSDVDKSDKMNPFARPRKMSLIVKEAVRSGAADGTPYYGVRKSGVWIPTAPEDSNSRGQSAPVRMMSISEDPDMAKMRKDSIAPIRPTSRLAPVVERQNQNGRSSLDNMSWYDISAPRV